MSELILAAKNIIDKWEDSFLNPYNVEDISRLENAINNEVSLKWISTEEQLPKPGKSVLGVYKTMYGKPRIIWVKLVEKFSQEMDCEKKFGEYSEYEVLNFNAVKITHWMLLPELPNM